MADPVARKNSKKAESPISRKVTFPTGNDPLSRERNTKKSPGACDVLLRRLFCEVLERAYNGAPCRRGAILRAARRGSNEGVVMQKAK